MEQKPAKRPYAKPYVLKVVLTPAENVLATCWAASGQPALGNCGPTGSCAITKVFIDPRVAPYGP